MFSSSFTPIFINVLLNSLTAGITDAIKFIEHLSQLDVTFIFCVISTSLIDTLLINVFKHSVILVEDMKVSDELVPVSISKISSEVSFTNVILKLASDTETL